MKSLFSSLLLLLHFFQSFFTLASTTGTNVYDPIPASFSHHVCSEFGTCSISLPPLSWASWFELSLLYSNVMKSLALRPPPSMVVNFGATASVMESSHPIGIPSSQKAQDNGGSSEGSELNGGGSEGLDGASRSSAGSSGAGDGGDDNDDTRKFFMDLSNRFWEWLDALCVSYPKCCSIFKVLVLGWNFIGKCNEIIETYHSLFHILRAFCQRPWHLLIVLLIMGPIYLGRKRKMAQRKKAKKNDN